MSPCSRFCSLCKQHEESTIWHKVWGYLDRKQDGVKIVDTPVFFVGKILRLRQELISPLLSADGLETVDIQTLPSGKENALEVGVACAKSVEVRTACSAPRSFPPLTGSLPADGRRTFEVEQQDAPQHDHCPTKEQVGAPRQAQRPGHQKTESRLQQLAEQSIWSRQARPERGICCEQFSNPLRTHGQDARGALAPFPGDLAPAGTEPPMPLLRAGTLPLHCHAAAPVLAQAFALTSVRARCQGTCAA